jgi:nicotinate-nucleotide pyrophosphorylase (carboxylating)
MIDPNTLGLDALWEHLARDGRARRLLELAREEDLANVGDVTADAMGAANDGVIAYVRARAPGVAAGLVCLSLLRDVFGNSVDITLNRNDGDPFASGDTLATIRGRLSDVVTIERTLLNLVGRMCGVATLTRRYVDAIAGSKARIVDTRKTTPGLRAFEKYAVRCGGGRSHRLGLYDAMLVKDNHIASIPLGRLTEELTNAARRAKERHDLMFVEVEVDSLAQFERVLAVASGLIDIALLDNMSPDTMREAARLRNESGSRLLLEASGGVRLETVRAIAETGVDRISVGALTHSAASLDLGLDID